MSSATFPTDTCAPERAPLLPTLPPGTYLLAAVPLTDADLARLGEQDVVRERAGLLLRRGRWQVLELHQPDGSMLEQPLPRPVSFPERDGLRLVLTDQVGDAERSALAAGHALELELPTAPWVPALCFDAPLRTEALVLDGAADGRLVFRAKPAADLAMLEPTLQAAGVRYGALLLLTGRPRLQPIAGRTLPGGVQLHAVQTPRGARELYARATSGAWYQLLT